MCRPLQKCGLTCVDRSSERFGSCANLTAKAGFRPNIWGIGAARQRRGNRPGAGRHRSWRPRDLSPGSHAHAGAASPPPELGRAGLIASTIRTRGLLTTIRPLAPNQSDRPVEARASPRVTLSPPWLRDHPVVQPIGARGDSTRTVSAPTSWSIRRLSRVDRRGRRAGRSASSSSCRDGSAQQLRRRLGQRRRLPVRCARHRRPSRGRSRSPVCLPRRQARQPGRSGGQTPGAAGASASSYSTSQDASSAPAADDATGSHATRPGTGSSIAAGTRFAPPDPHRIPQDTASKNRRHQRRRPSTPTTTWPEPRTAHPWSTSQTKHRG